MLACITMLGGTTAAQQSHYVRTGGTCNANCTTSFSSAYGSLQSALAAATAGDTILVAQGTYKPTAGTDRSISFNIPSGVLVYGGFEGGATELYTTQSQPQVYETILSGEIGTAADTDNSYHVIKVTPCNSDITLYGLVVEAGNANHLLNNPDRIGGGLRYDNNPGSGGLRVSHCIFRQNKAAKAGGGIHASRGDLRIDHCTFEANTQSGGALSTAYGGGGVFLWSTGTMMEAEISYCRFMINEMTYRAALGLHGTHDVKVFNTLFSGNHNTGILSGSGVAVYGHDADNARLVNCTFIANETDGLLNGNTIDCHTGSSNFDIQNSIVWGNMPAVCHPVSGNVDDVVYCDIEHFSTWAGPAGSTTGTMEADPLMVGGEGQLSAFSPCVDTGLDSYISDLSDTDLRGADRIIDQDCSGSDNTDMGAFEVQAGENQRIYISPAGDDSDGLGWSTAFHDLQDGITLANYCHTGFCNPNPEIWVAAATYTPGTSVSQTFMADHDMAIYGGFDGTEEDLSERPPLYSTNATVISGDLGGGSHSHHLFKVDGAALLVDGFYLNGATADNAHGGAFLVYNNAQLTLRNARVHNNTADLNGGGIHLQASQLTCEDVRFDHNSATNGAALTVYDGSVAVLQDCTFETNTAGQAGGAVYTHFNDPGLTVNDVIFEGNSASRGGALCQEGGIQNTDGCVFSGNEATMGGAVYTSSGVQADITQSDFQSNAAALDGGALYLDECQFTAANCTLGVNAAGRGGALYAEVSTLLFDLGLWEYNTADTGGAIYVADQCTLTMRNTKAFENSSAGNGGFICNNSMSDIYLGNLYVTGNTAGGNGGVFSAEHDSADFYMTNVVGLCNSADGAGNIYYSDAEWCAMELYFGSFYGNTHPDGITSAHTVIEKIGYISAVVNSCIFFQNQDRTFCEDVFVSYTNTDGLWDCNGVYQGSEYPGPLNINADPAFVDVDGPDNSLCTLDDDLRINGNGTTGTNSLCIDAGMPTAYMSSDLADLDNDGNYEEILPVDILDNPRIDAGAYNSEPDMGAYESDGSYKGSRNAVNEKPSILIFPNPATDRVTVVLDRPIRDIGLYNMQGALQCITKTITGNDAVLDTSLLAPGLYFVEVNDGVYTRRQSFEKF